VQRGKLAGLVAGIAVLAACSNETQISTPTEQAPAPLLAVGKTALPDRYIVVFKQSVSDVDAETDRATRGNGSQVHFKYSRVLKGFAATIPAAALDGIRHNPNVEYVEPDGVAEAIGTQAAPPSWGIDRIDQRNLPLSSSYQYNNDGAGVRVYILDTGIRYTHEQYSGRAITGLDFVDNDSTAEECHGHGTHVAGTVGGNTTGVAKQVALVGVRVLNCQGSGSYTGIIAAVDWVTGEQSRFPGVGFVGNMSLGGGLSPSLNTAVNNSVNQGVVWALAAGNENTDACTRSPASAANALTVGATGSNDVRASFSNFGTCVDLFAPGVGILSSTKTSDNSYESWSGTSMATPHAAGVAALYRAANPTATAAQTIAAIVNGATTNVVGDPVGSPNLLLYSLVAGTAPNPPANTPPTAAYTYSCTNLVCSFNGSSSSDLGGSIQSYSWSFGDGSPNGSGATLNHTFPATGAYTVVLTVTDNGNLQDTESKSVSVTAAASTVPVHVGNLGGATTNNGNNWKAVITVAVHDGSHAAVSGATVNGSFSTGGTGSCVTAANGTCTITSGAIRKNIPSSTFNVTGVSGSGLSYAAGSNHDVDGGSNGTTIIVTR